MVCGGVSSLGLDGNSSAPYGTEKWEGSTVSGTHAYTSTHAHVCCDAPVVAALGSCVCGLVPAWLPRWQVREWVRVLEPLVNQRPLLLWKELGLWSQTIWGWNPGFLSHLLDDFSQVTLSEPVSSSVKWDNGSSGLGFF